MATEWVARSGNLEKCQILHYELVVGEEDTFMIGPDGLTGPFKTPINTEGIEYRTLLMLVGMLRDNHLRRPEVELLGEYLYRLVLNNKIGEELHTTLTTEHDAFMCVRLKFENPNSQLVNLPWEYLFHRETASSGRSYFLATEERLALVRSPKVDNCRALSFDFTENETHLKALIVACSPSDLQRLDFRELVESVEMIPDLELKTLITEYTDSPALATKSQGLPKATFKEFVKLMHEFNPHVVHFLGHGKFDSSGGKVAFAGGGYLADWYSGGDLARELNNQQSVRLAFLQACESAVADGESAIGYRALTSVAGDLVRTGIPAVVAMQASVENAAANSFAEAFYGALITQRQPIYRAMQLARTRTSEAACVPVLYLVQDKGTKKNFLEGRLFPSTQPEPVSKSPNGIGPPPVPIAAVQIDCPWCNYKCKGVKPDDLCCDNCGSPIRCSNEKCRRDLGHEIPSGEKSTRCRVCSTKLYRHVESTIPTEATSSAFDGGAAVTQRIYPEKVDYNPGDKHKPDDVYGVDYA